MFGAGHKTGCFLSRPFSPVFFFLPWTMAWQCLAEPKLLHGVHQRSYSLSSSPNLLSFLFFPAMMRLLTAQSFLVAFSKSFTPECAVAFFPRFRCFYLTPPLVALGSLSFLCGPRVLEVASTCCQFLNQFVLQGRLFSRYSFMLHFFHREFYTMTVTIRVGSLLFPPYSPHPQYLSTRGPRNKPPFFLWDSGPVNYSSEFMILETEN